MTIVACPHGCGGAVNTAKDVFCPSCRRPLNATEVVIPETVDCETGYWYDAHQIEATTARKESWCWQWWGPPDHRMRCRLPKGHDGEHDTHEQRQDCMIVATDGTLVKP